MHHDAILTTAATVINDNPALNVRLPHRQVGKSIFIIDRCLKVTAQAQVLSSATSVTFFHAADAVVNKVAFGEYTKVKWVPVALKNGLLDLDLF